ncbi:unnamed protein product [Pylaiella littoralis]
MEEGRKSCRLPDTVVPRKYSLIYEDLDLDRCTFSGSVAIDCEVKSAVARVELHALELWVTSADAVIDGGNKVSSVKTEYDAKAQTVTLCFEEALGVGEVKLHLKFEGSINDKLAGLYRSKYTGPDGEVKTMAVTQFEATDARRAFPCWDEPSIKARFELEVLAPLDRRVVSNTPVMMSNEETAVLPSGRKERRRRWRFAETPVMSTYLLALVVGEFDFVSAYNKSGVLTTVYTPVGKAEQGRFALHVASKALEYYAETVFKVPYPLQKSDLLAIPDFAAGAMENWGCVTYREARLLVHEATSSTATKKAIARTVCHELAHQWFGNLVTMEWWDALWLNEGFARYMEFVAVDHIFPEWDIWADFDSMVFPQAMGLDALVASHPIEVKVDNPDQINEIFDAISYAKGASVIRMLAGHLGVTEFMRGIHDYLVKHSYGNARSDDLWTALGNATGKDVATLMDTWTRKVGYPVLTLAEDGSTSQARFLAMADAATVEKGGGGGGGTVWPIPARVVWEGAADEEELVVMLEGGGGGGGGGGREDDRKLMDKVQELQAAGKWFKVNAGQRGFFKVNYTDKGWANLSRAMQSMSVSPADRAGAVSDAFSLAAAGLLETSVALDLASKLKNDPDNLVRQTVVSSLVDLISLYSEEEFFEEFQLLVRSICQPMWESITWTAADGEPQRVATLRPLLLRTLHLSGYKEIDEEALKRFDAYANDRAGSAPPADLRYAILATAVGVRGDSAFRQSRGRQPLGALFSSEESDPPAGRETTRVIEIYRATDSGEEKRQCLSAIGKAKDPALLAEAMDFILDSGEVRLQDAGLALASLATSALGSKLVWSAFQDRYVELHERFSDTGFIWPMLVGSAVMGPRTPEHLKELETFFKQAPKPIGAGERKWLQNFEKLRVQVAQLARDRATVPAALQQ